MSKFMYYNDAFENGIPVKLKGVISLKDGRALRLVSHDKTSPNSSRNAVVTERATKGNTNLTINDIFKNTYQYIIPAEHIKISKNTSFNKLSMAQICEMWGCRTELKLTSKQKKGLLIEAVRRASLTKGYYDNKYTRKPIKKVIKQEIKSMSLGDRIEINKQAFTFVCTEGFGNLSLNNYFALHHMFAMSRINSEHSIENMKCHAIYEYLNRFVPAQVRYCENIHDQRKKIHMEFNKLGDSLSSFQDTLKKQLIDLSKSDSKLTILNEFDALIKTHAGLGRDLIEPMLNSYPQKYCTYMPDYPKHLITLSDTDYSQLFTLILERLTDHKKSILSFDKSFQAFLTPDTANNSTPLSYYDGIGGLEKCSGHAYSRDHPAKEVKKKSMERANSRKKLQEAYEKERAELLAASSNEKNSYSSCDEEEDYNLGEGIPASIQHDAEKEKFTKISGLISNSNDLKTLHSLMIQEFGSLNGFNWEQVILKGKEYISLRFNQQYRFLVYKDNKVSDNLIFKFSNHYK